MVASKLSLGNTEILVLHDNETSLPLSMTFPDVAPQDWIPYQEQYPEGFNGPDDLKVHFECYLIRSEGRTILVDTGLGGNQTNAGSVEAFAGGVGGRLFSINATSQRTFCGMAASTPSESTPNSNGISAPGINLR